MNPPAAETIVHCGPHIALVQTETQLASFLYQLPDMSSYQILWLNWVYVEEALDPFK